MSSSLPNTCRLIRSPSYVVVSLLRKREKTPYIKATLDPVYPPKDATFEFPVFLSLAETMGALELVVWDKDMFGRDYLGEVALPIQNWFQSQPILFDDPANEVGQENVGAPLAPVTHATYLAFLSAFGIYTRGHAEYRCDRAEDRSRRPIDARCIGRIQNDCTTCSGCRTNIDYCSSSESGSMVVWSLNP